MATKKELSRRNFIKKASTMAVAAPAAGLIVNAAKADPVVYYLYGECFQANIHEDICSKDFINGPT